MFKKFFSFFLLLSFSLTISAFCADFSADMITKAKGAPVINGKVFVKDNKSRMEIEARGMKSVSINRGDKNIMWNLMPDQKMYMEMSYNPQSMATTVNAVDKSGKIESVLLGKDMIDGRSVDKYKVTVSNDKGKVVILQWIDPSLKLPVKVAAEDGSFEIDYSNVKLGNQEDSLFEVPAGYQKFSMPSMADMFKSQAK